MKRTLKTYLCVCVCIFWNSALLGAEDVPVSRPRGVVRMSPATRAIPQTARSNAGSVFDENIRLTLLVERLDAEPLSVSVVTAQSLVSLDSLAGVVEIDGNAVPVMMRFKASIEPLGEGEYFVSYDFNMSRPVVTSVSTTKGAVGRSSFQYQQMGVEASARIGMNQSVTILKDPDKEVHLELRTVDE